MWKSLGQIKLAFQQHKQKVCKKEKKKGNLLVKKLRDRSKVKFTLGASDSPVRQTKTKILFMIQLEKFEY